MVDHPLNLQDSLSFPVIQLNISAMMCLVQLLCIITSAVLQDHPSISCQDALFLSMEQARTLCKVG